MADIHLCPTISSAHNVMRHNNLKKGVHVVGNTVLDNLVDYTTKSEDFVLVTMHRRENHQNIQDWFIHINDLARAIISLCYIEPLNTEVNISSGIEVKISKLIYLIEEITSKKILTNFKELREIDITRSVLDNSLIKSLTDWEPLIVLEEGIDKFMKNDLNF